MTRPTLLAAGLLAAALLAAALPDAALAQTARTTVLADSVSVGQPFEVAIAVDHGPGRSVLFPEPPEALPGAAPALTVGDAEILAVRRLPPRPRAGGRTDSAVVTAVVFAVDTARVGPVPVRLVTGADTARLLAPAALVPVRSVLGGEADPVPAPLGEPSPFPSPVPLLVALGVGAALLLVAALWLLARVLRKPAPAAVRPAPYPEALARLETLDAEAPTPQTVEAHFDALRDTLRTYLGRRLGVSAREATTSELVAVLDADARVTDEGRAAVRDVLRVTDLVAFARLRPPVEAAADARRTTREAIETVEASVREHERAEAEYAADAASTPPESVPA